MFPEDSWRYVEAEEGPGHWFARLGPWTLIVEGAGPFSGRLEFDEGRGIKTGATFEVLNAAKHHAVKLAQSYLEAMMSSLPFFDPWEWGGFEGAPK